MKMKFLRDLSRRKVELFRNIIFINSTNYSGSSIGEQ
jgi:hypothetical protein